MYVHLLRIQVANHAPKPLYRWYSQWSVSPGAQKDEQMTNTPHPFAHRWSEDWPITFTEAVFVRPKMYTINGTVEEVAAFLEGFYSGLAAHTRDAQRMAEAQQWWNFHLRLHHHVPNGAGKSWFDLVGLLRADYGDDQPIFFQLIQWYQAYRHAGSGMHSMQQE